MNISIYGKSMCPLCMEICEVLDSSYIPYEYYQIEYMTPDQIMYLTTDLAPGVKELPIIILDRNRRITIDELREIILSKDSTTERVG